MINVLDDGMHLDLGRHMPSKLVTCPETAHLEQIEYEDHPLGLLITACTGFQPACGIGCPRTCTARLDRGRNMVPDLDLDEEDTQVDIFAMMRA